MPQTKLGTYLFMAVTVAISVTAFAIYNVALELGSMSPRVFSLALREVPMEFSIAFLLEALFVYKLAQRLAFRFVDPQIDRPIVIILAITSMTICLMCPAMSFISTLIHTGLSPELPVKGLQKMVFNFPFAFFTQIFFIGPLVRNLFVALSPASVSEAMEPASTPQDGPCP